MMKINLLLSVALVMIMAAQSPAQDPPTHVELPNGISVLVQETYSSPTVSLNVFVRVGSLHETPENSGISHFYEHMFFRGTPKRSGLQFKRAIEALGGTTNATTSRDFTHYYINLPSQYVDEGLELLADALINAECSPDSVTKEREVVLEEYRLGRSSPARMLSDRLFSMAFKQHPYGRAIIGTEENLKNIDRQDLLKFKRTYYVPDRTSLVVIGDVDKKQTVEKLRALFGSFRGNRSPEDNFALDGPPAETVVTTEQGSDSRTFVVLGFVGPSVKDRPDIYQMDVLSFLLGAGEGSVLQKGMVDARVADAARVDFLTQAYPSLVMLTAAGDTKNKKAMQEGLLAGIEQVKAGDFTDKDLARAKVVLSSSFRFGNETNAGKADSLGFYESIDNWKFSTGYLEGVEQVTRQDVIAAAEHYLSQNYCGLVMEPEPRQPRRGR